MQEPIQIPPLPETEEPVPTPKQQADQWSEAEVQRMSARNLPPLSINRIPSGDSTGLPD